MKDNFDTIDAAEIENNPLKKPFNFAVKFAASSCTRCPFDSDIDCTRPAKDMDCESAVKLYFRNEGKICSGK